MQVICINDYFPDNLKHVIPNRPEKGKIYIIRLLFKVPIIEPCYAVLLNEISNPPVDHSSGLGTYEPSFNANRFTDLLGNKLKVEELAKDFKKNPTINEL